MQPRRPPRAPEDEERERERSPRAPGRPSRSREQPPGAEWSPPARRPRLPGPRPTPASSGLAPPAPWGPRGTWLQRGRCANCTTVTCRTLSHPAFWPLFEPAWVRPVPWNSAPRAALSQPLPGLSRDTYYLDPLLPPGQRVPVHLQPQQARGSLRLLLPPPVSSPCVVPSRPPRLVWLTAAELVALIGLLQMSMGEPRREPPEPAARPARPRRADPYPRRPPDAPGP